jgi:hypothetical protein
MSVLSVQRVQITLGVGTATANTNITVTNIDNCVPFMSKRIVTASVPGDNFTEHAVDISFATGPDRVIATTNEFTNRALVVEVGVVEFDGTDTEVTSGIYEMDEALSDTSNNPGLTVKNNAFLIHTWQVESTGGNWENSNVRGVVTSTTELAFDRANGTGTIYGHWWTVESTDGSFAVQHKELNVALDTYSGTVALTSIDEDKTFLIGSYKGGPNDDTEDCTIDVVLSSNVLITATRDNDSSSAVLDWGGCAVTFDAGGSEEVKRGEALNTTATNADIDLPGDPVGTLANCVAFTSGNVGSMAHGMCSGNASLDPTEAQTAWTFVDDNTVRYDRHNAQGRTATISFETIEWDVGGAPPVVRRVMVIS